MKIFRRLFITFAILTSAFVIAGLSFASVHKVTFNEEIKSWFTSKVEASETPKEPEQPSEDKPNTDNPGIDTPVEEYPVEEPIPETEARYFNFDNGTVTGLSEKGESLYENGELTEISIPATYTVDDTEYEVTSIGKNAFAWKVDFTRVDIPDTVTTIKENAFWLCGLKNLNIPNSVISIEQGAFLQCVNLINMKISNNIESIGEGAFAGCGVDNIFGGNESYKAVNNCLIETSTNTLLLGSNKGVIPDNVISIGTGAFQYCKDLTVITIPNSVKAIGNLAFSGSGLTSITIPINVTSLGESVFEQCKSLISATLPDSITSISSGLFRDCSNLISVVLGKEVTSIESNAFNGCTGLANITIPSSVTSIEQAAFKGCAGLTSIRIPSSVTNLSSAFTYCTGLTSINIPKSLTFIDNCLFSNCTALTSIVCEGEVPPTFPEYFYFGELTSLEKIYVPVGCGETYKTAEGWSRYADLIVEIEE